MNAYELADRLTTPRSSGEEAMLVINHAIPMLRQQADRIDRLEREAVARNNYLEQHCQKIDQQADRIAELEKEITRLIGAEPITYGTFTVCKNCGQQDPYTQTKPLSDEEIYSLLDKCIEYVDDHDHAEFMYKKFARAIEERHGIK